MELTSLRYFLVAARLLHFGLAAEELGIAQPALSQRIKALEARVGASLFDRSKRAVQLTEAGKVFQERASRLVVDADRAVRLARSAEKGLAGDLHVGYGGSVVFEPRVCQLLQDFRLAYPAVNLMMHEYSVVQQLERLRAGDIDVALLWGPLGPACTDLQKVVLKRTRMTVVLHGDHPLASLDEIRLDDMREESFIALMDPPGIGIGHVVEQMFEAAGLVPQITMRVSSLMSVFGLACAGMGIGIVPDLPLQIVSPAFVRRPLSGSQRCNEVLVVTAQASPSRMADNFTTMAQGFAAQVEQC